jgi:hypothetical protein
MKKKKSNNTVTKKILYVPLDRDPEFNSEVELPKTLSKEDVLDLIVGGDDAIDENEVEKESQNGNAE